MPQLQEDAVRPIIAHTRLATCWQLWLKGLSVMSNSIYNGWRMEDVWPHRQR
jgi:peptide/nickel transport system substrate-binding protein